MRRTGCRSRGKSPRSSGRGSCSACPRWSWRTCLARLPRKTSRAYWSEPWLRLSSCGQRQRRAGLVALADYDTLSSAGERDSPRTGGSLCGMPCNNSTASFELFNAEFDWLNRSPCPEPLSDANSPSTPAHLLYPPARGGGDATGWGRAAPDGGTSLWTHDGVAERAVAHTFHMLLGARTGAGGFGAEAAGRSLGADLRAQHCLDAQHWRSGADPDALDVAGGLDTLDAAASLLLLLGNFHIT
ncbi:hypothetical protein T492DRAFT_1009243 [Pavlovales sp. CCMP2436]|nr:hypothetical protein T492DRAFT_1009243 [Pavlovales sp. CCMP2436]